MFWGVKLQIKYELCPVLVAGDAGRLAAGGGGGSPVMPAGRGGGANLKNACQSTAARPAFISHESPKIYRKLYVIECL